MACNRCRCPRCGKTCLASDLGKWTWCIECEDAFMDVLREEMLLDDVDDDDGLDDDGCDDWKEFDDDDDDPLALYI